MTIAATDDTVRVRPGVGLHVRHWEPARPAGAPWLLVHGLASNARMWDGVARRLAEAGHRAVAVDQRGHGLSDAPDDGYDFATVVEDLRLLARACGLVRPVLVGQSWGGNVVLAAAAEYGDDLAGVAAVDGGTIDLQARFPRWEDCAEQLAPPLLDGMSAVRLEARLRRMLADWPDEGIAGAMANFAVREDGTVRPHLRRDRHMQILRALWEQRPRTLYPRVGAPVVLISADTSDHGWTAEKRASLDEAAASLDAVRIEWLTGHHDLHAEQPDAVTGILLDAVRDGFFRPA